MKKALRFPVSIFLLFSVLCATQLLADAPAEIEAAPPANDACANAIALMMNADLNCSTTLNGTTTDATASVPAITGCGGTADDDVWFSFVATGPSHRIKVSGGTQAMYFQVFSGACGSLTSLLCSANIGIGTTGEVQVNSLATGQTYYIRVYTTSNLVYTNFNICVGTPPPAPSNDECAGAVNLTVNTDLTCGAVLNSTTAGGTPSVAANCAGAEEDDDVWYKFVATGPTHRVKITGASSNIAVQVFSGTCAGLTVLVCVNSFSNSLEQALYGLTAGQTYYLRVFTRENLVFSDFTICVGTPPPAPANDECAGAINLTVNADLSCGTVLTSTTSGGTPSAAANCASAEEDDDVWYKFVATGPTHRVKITGASSDIAVQVFSGTCAGLTVLVCVNSFSNSLEQALYGLTAGQTYYLRVFTRENLVFSDFTICVGTPPPAPANDECAGAINLTVNADLSCGTVLTSTTSGGTPSAAANCASAEEDDDVWYKFVATGPTHRVKITGASSDIAVQVFSGTCAGLTVLVCVNSFSNSLEQALYGLTAGQTYYLRVFTRENLAFSDFTICVGTPPPAPANDECAGAITLAVNSNLNCGAVLQTTTSGGTPSVAANCASAEEDDDVWYKFVATGASHWIFIAGNTEDMAVQTFSGSCGSLVAITCTNPFNSNVLQQLTGLAAGQTYYVRVFTRTNLTFSDFSICVGTPTAPPANDLCAGAIVLTVNADTLCVNTSNGTTSGATASSPTVGGCSGTADEDVWFKFVANGTAQIVRVTNATRPLTLQAFSGVCGSLTSLGCTSSNVLGTVELSLANLVVGQTYLVRVYTTQNQVYSDFTVCVAAPPPPPPNDLCADAVNLIVNPDLSCTQTSNATTVGATASSPAISGCSGTADDDVWFKFVATGPSHRVKITGATQNMVAQLFSGACGALVSLTCNDPLGANIEFQQNSLTTGATYYVRVYTRSNLVYSNFTICIGTPPPAPANDECTNAVSLVVNPDLFCADTLNTTTTGGTPSQSGCSGTADDDVWYRFVATGPSHRIKITGATQNMVAQLFSGACGALVSLTCNDPLGENIEFQQNGLTAGATYYVRVYTRSNLVYSNFTICVGTPPPSPANDECTNAVSLVVNPDLFCADILNTTTTGGTPSQSSCSGSSDDDVWYRFVATGPNHRVKITGATQNMVAQLFSGACGALVSLTCNDPLGENIEFQQNGLTAGATYYVRVYTRSNLVYSNFTICVGTPPPPPANDECTNAVSLVVNPDLFCADTLNTTTTGGTPSQSGCSGTADDDVWYRFVATGPSHRIKVSGGAENLVLQAFSGACGSLVSLACNDPLNENVELQLNDLTPGNSYYVRVYTRFNLTYSNFTICITTVVPPPANDLCSSAISLTVNPDLSCANTLTATTNGGLPSNPAISGCFGTADDDVWFKFVATGPSHRVRVSGVTKAMVLQSFSGVCGTLTSLACTTSYPSTGTVEHQLNGLTAGATYYVRAYTYLNLVSSNFTICIGTPPPPPANDECAGAFALVVNPNMNCVDTLNATTAGALQSLPACTGAAADDDVWFKFTALADSQTVSVTNGTEALVLQIFSGDCNSLSSLSCDYSLGGSPSRKLTGLTPGSTYYLRVYTSDNLDYSNFTICVTVPVTAPAIDTLCKVISFQAPDEGDFPTDCGVAWQEDGVPMQVANACGGNNSCFYDFNVVGTGLFLAPGTLQLTIAPECGNRVTRIEIDVVDYCGIGCTNAAYLDGMAVIGVDSNTISTQLETFVFQTPANSNLTQVNICSFEGVVQEVRIYCLKEVTVGAKVFLQGPYVSGVQLMHDSLRIQNRIPLTEPYTGLTGFVHKGCGGGEQTRASVLAVTGPNAIVDWVFLELRDADTPALVVATRAALVQRDGDVVDVDGVSSVGFGHDLDTGSYYLAIRHRNHLGVQLGAPKFYERGAAVLTNFTTLPPEGFYAHNGLSPAQRIISGKYALWAGNGRTDTQLKYNGSNNDRNAILSVVGLATPNAVVPGYRIQDYNLDGVVKYNGSVNDRNVLLGNVGIATPSAVVEEQVAR